jgi:hypothetical protein
MSIETPDHRFFRQFMAPDGTPYRILPNGGTDQNRQVCRALLEHYRKLFRLSGIKGLPD